MDKDQGQWSTVTEVGVFGDLSIADPTVKKVLTEEEQQILIEQTQKENLKNL